MNTTHNASRHWRWQRISAIVLVPLTLWFVFAIVQRIGDDHASVANWIAQPAVALALITYLIATFFHAQLGWQVIIEDYVSTPRTRRNTVRAIGAINICAASIAVMSVLWIAVTG